VLTAETFTSQRSDRLAAIQQRHFWFVGRLRLVAALAADDLRRPGRVLDVGCGAGATLRWLLDEGHDAVGVDSSPVSLEHAARLVPAEVLHRGDALHLPFVDASFDGAFLLDVLEHLDDAAALSEVRRVLRPGGWLMISVPAYDWLWSVRDHDAGHRRRYSRPALVGTVEESGFVVEWVTYYQCALLPVLAAGRLATRRIGGRRLRDREERVPGRLNRALTIVSSAEATVAARVGLPWGSSLVLRGRRAA
jgi:SAM-dependent methyltransferase